DGGGGKGKGKGRGGAGRSGPVDPLDPEAAGYTERPYNLNKQGGPQQRGGAHAAAYGPSQGPAPQPGGGGGGATAGPGPAAGAAGSGTLGPVQGPSRPAPKPAVSEDLLRMKPVHLRVQRPGGVSRAA
ncbi:unnamed protein product, partial [Ectocarpus sp. 8 AP-2014]